MNKNTMKKKENKKMKIYVIKNDDHEGMIGGIVRAYTDESAAREDIDRELAAYKKAHPEDEIVNVTDNTGSWGWYAQSSCYGWYAVATELRNGNRKED